MARTFDQVLADITKQSDPQRQTILNTVADLPNQLAAEETSLAAKKDQAYDDILGGARRRGTGVAFGGIPLSEQAKYNATEYAPAVARMKSGFNDRKSSLELALADIGKNDYSNAYNIFNTERSFEEQQQQFNEQQRAARAAAAAEQGNANAYLQMQRDMMGAGGAGVGAPAAAKMTKTAKGFNFVDGTGRGINAAQYAQLAGVGYRDLLSQMAKAGDKNAQLALRYVGNDGKFGNAPQSAAGALTALGAMGSYTQPKSYAAAPANNPYAVRNWATGKF